MPDWLHGSTIVSYPSAPAVYTSAPSPSPTIIHCADGHLINQEHQLFPPFKVTISVDLQSALSATQCRSVGRQSQSRQSHRTIKSGCSIQTIRNSTRLTLLFYRRQHWTYYNDILHNYCQVLHTSRGKIKKTPNNTTVGTHWSQFNAGQQYVRYRSFKGLLFVTSILWLAKTHSQVESYSV